MTIEIGDSRPAEWASWLATSGWVPPDPTPVPQPVRTDAPVDIECVAAWTAVDLVVTTVDPVRAQSRTAGNVVQGHDHLPGTLLLPWLSDRWGDALVRRAVLADALAVRNVYPEVGSDRGLPVPFTMFRAKGAAPTVGVGTAEGDERPVRRRWVGPAPENGTVLLQRPDTALAAHNHVDRARQRPTASTGIYQVEVIPGGRRMRGRVLLDDGVVAALRAVHGAGWASLLAGPARFGARRGGEYGRCIVEVGEPRPVAVPPVPGPGPLVLWAAADLLVDGLGLRPSADPADVAAAVATLLDAPVTVDRATARTGRRDGWHGRWQLPRESLVGVAAGSVLELRVPPSARIDPAGWARLVAGGLGERRAEGFGEVVVNPILLATASRYPVDDRSAAEHLERLPGGDPNGPEADTLAALERAVRRDGIVAALAGVRAGDDHRSLRAALAQLSPSQRGTWRAVTADAAVAGRPARVREFAEGWRQSQHPGRAGQRAVADRVIELITGERRVEHVLGVAPASDPERAWALAVLVGDVVDALAREEDV